MSILLSLIYFTISISAAIRVIMTKRNPLAAALWLVTIWFAPYLGPLLYYLLGINRVKRKAIHLRRGIDHYRYPVLNHYQVDAHALREHGIPDHFKPLVKSVHNLTEQHLLAGNRIVPLFSGETAYSAMIAEITAAKQSIALMTYIFHADGIGEKFIAALRQAHVRGVKIRVLLDGVMAHLAQPSITQALRAANIPYALFNSPLLAHRVFFLNLRSHRKICVIDGRIGFTGGFNIHRDYWSPDPGKRVFQDTHFRLTGPIVTHLSNVFVDEWLYSSGETLRGDPWFSETPELQEIGSVLARGIAAGPDERWERLRGSYLTALNVATQSVRIMSPYFIPDEVLLAAIDDAINRQVAVDILIPESGSKVLLAATMGRINETLKHGARLWLCPPPFNHSKLMIVDDQWLLMGSGNWDERSLRLNYEFDVECYDSVLVGNINNLFSAHQKAARQLTYEAYRHRPFHERLFDGCARLLSPFL